MMQQRKNANMRRAQNIRSPSHNGISSRQHSVGSSSSTGSGNLRNGSHGSISSDQSPKSSLEVPIGIPEAPSYYRQVDMRKKKTKGMSIFTKLFILIIICAGGGATYHFYQQYELEKEARMQQEAEVSELKPLLKKWEDKHAKLEQELLKLKESYNVMQESNEKLKGEKGQAESKSNKLKSESTVLQRKVKKFEEQKLQLQRSIQEHARQALVHKFGNRRRVEITIVFWGENVGRIVIEMAPDDLMPHSVYTFMQQVDKGLWDGCSFHVNPGHVLQASPVSNWKTPEGLDLKQRFASAGGIDKVEFQEYSPAFPHYENTVGFSGRPGGPDFYFSTRNNVENHGPTKKGDEIIDGDPCFGKIIDGFEHLQRIKDQPIKSDGSFEMEHPVVIREMKIL